MEGTSEDHSTGGNEAKRQQDEAMAWAAQGISRKTCSWVKYLSPG